MDKSAGNFSVCSRDDMCNVAAVFDVRELSVSSLLYVRYRVVQVVVVAAAVCSSRCHLIIWAARQYWRIPMVQDLPIKTPWKG